MKKRKPPEADTAQGTIFDAEPKSGGKEVPLIPLALLAGKTQTQVVNDPKGELYDATSDWRESDQATKERVRALINERNEAQKELADLRETLDADRIAKRKLEEIVENRLCSRGVGPATRCMCCDAVRDVIETSDDDFRTLEEKQEREQFAPTDEPEKIFQFPYMRSIQVHQTELNRSGEYP
jgi:alanyl-tRNA synthetase